MRLKKSLELTQMELLFSHRAPITLPAERQRDLTAALNWSSRLSKDYELRHTSAETMIHIAFVHLLLRRSS